MKITDLYRELLKSAYECAKEREVEGEGALGGRDRERESLKAQLIAQHSQYQIKSVLMNCTNLYRLPLICRTLEKGKREKLSRWVEVQIRNT